MVSLVNNKFKFNIYSKPTQTDSIIPYSSNHTFLQKFHIWHDWKIKIFEGIYPKYGSKWL